MSSIQQLFMIERIHADDRRRHSGINWGTLVHHDDMPSVRHMVGPSVSMWGDTIDYVHDLANGERFRFRFDTAYRTCRCTHHSYSPVSGYRHDAEMHFTVHGDPREWWTYNRVQAIKRALRIRVAARIKVQMVPRALRERHRKQSMGVYSDVRLGLLERHRTLTTRVDRLHEDSILRNSEHHEVSRGWLRLKRHVVRDPGIIAYSVEDEHALDGKVSWPRYAHRPLKGRVRGRFSKLCAACGIAPHVAGLMAQEWAAAHANNVEYEELKGQAIVDAYRRSVGVSSCMTGCEGAEYVTMYATDPDKISMIVLKVDGVVSGRAILWKLDEPIEGITHHLDRTYPQSDKVCALYQRYAEKRGNCTTYSQGDLPRSATCTVPAPDNEAIPYFDTFSGVNVRTVNGVRCFVATRGCADYDGDSTEGGALFNGDCYIYCAGCDERISQEDASSDGWDSYCYSCFEERFTCCAQCGETIRFDACGTHEVEGGEYVCQYCKGAYYSVCGVCDELVHTNTKMHGSIRVDGESTCRECAADYTSCFNCGDAHITDHMTEQQGQLVCDCCRDTDKDEV